MITAAVGFDEDSFRCAGELEHSCKQHSSKQTGGDIHTSYIHTALLCILATQHETGSIESNA